MKKSGAIIICLAIMASFSLAGSSAPAVFGLAGTPLTRVNSLVAMVGGAFSTTGLPADPATLAETSLPDPNLMPLMALDVYPAPLKTQSSRDYSALNLDPRKAVVESRLSYGRPNIRISAAGDTLFTASLLSMVALNVADFLSTKECLKYPGLAEGNPLMKPFVKDPYAFAAVKVAFTAFSYWNMKNLYKKSKPLGWVASVAANLALSYVVSNNYRLLGQAKAIAGGRLDSSH